MESHRLGSSVPAAQNVTVDEVISAYKQACQKLNCRQIPKLLRQLQVCRQGRGSPSPSSLWASVVCPSAGAHGTRTARLLTQPRPLLSQTPWKVLSQL